MVKYIINQWKSKRVTVALIITGFLVASIVLSFGISICRHNFEYAYQQFSGDPQKQMEITIQSKENAGISIHLLEQIKSFGELQLLNCGNVLLDDYKVEYQIVPIWFEKSIAWHVPILNGRYFEEKELEPTKKEIVIGREIAKQHNVSTGDTLKINMQDFVVIGICGLNERETQWDSVIYVTVPDFTINNIDYILSIENLFAVIKSGKQEFLDSSEEIMQVAEKYNNTIRFQGFEEEIDYGIIRNSIVITVLSSGIIFIIAMVNITNLMIYWIMERRKEFGIIKAIGGTNRYIVKCIIFEIVIMTIISAFLAIILQSCFSWLFEDILVSNGIYVKVTYVNYLISIIVAMLCGIVAAIIPAKRAITVQPSEILKTE